MSSIDEYLSGLEGKLRETAEKARGVIEAALPEATGAVWHGHPVWGAGEKPGARPVCLLKAYKSYVTVGFWRGQDLGDERLVPGARRMASVKLTSVGDIDADALTGLLRRAYELETR